MTSFSAFKQTIQDKLSLKSIGIGIALLILALLFFTWRGLSLPWITTNSTTEIKTVILGGLKNISELNTVKMLSKATVVETEDNRLFSLTLGNTKVIYEGVGIIRAGIDMRGLEAKEVDADNHKVKIILPPPYIIETVLDVERSELLDHHRNWFGPNTEIDLQEKAQKDAIEKIRLEACENGILEAANKNAQEIVENILSVSGYTDIIIETQSPKTSYCHIA